MLDLAALVLGVLLHTEELLGPWGDGSREGMFMLDRREGGKGKSNVRGDLLISGILLAGDLPSVSHGILKTIQDRAHNVGRHVDLCCCREFSRLMKVTSLL